MTLGLHCPAKRPPPIPCIRELRDAGFVEQVLPVENRNTDVEVGKSIPLGIDHAQVPRREQPATILLANTVHHIGEIDQLAVVERRQDLPLEEKNVVSGACGRLGSDAGGQLELRIVVYAHRHAVRSTPVPGKFIEIGVVIGDEVVPREDAQRRPLDLRRGNPGLPRRHPGQRTSGDPDSGSCQKLSASQPPARTRSSSSVHRVPPLGPRPPPGGPWFILRRSSYVLRRSTMAHTSTANTQAYGDTVQPVPLPSSSNIPSSRSTGGGARHPGTTAGAPKRRMRPRTATVPARPTAPPTNIPAEGPHASMIAPIISAPKGAKPLNTSA